MSTVTLDKPVVVDPKALEAEIIKLLAQLEKPVERVSSVDLEKLLSGELACARTFST